jgi:hypothetical protein
VVGTGGQGGNERQLRLMRQCSSSNVHGLRRNGHARQLQAFAEACVNGAY